MILFGQCDHFFAGRLRASRSPRCLRFISMQPSHRRAPSRASGTRGAGREDRRDPHRFAQHIRLDDPNEDKWAFRLVNNLHVKTRPELIERLLLSGPASACPMPRDRGVRTAAAANRFLLRRRHPAAAYRDARSRQRRGDTGHLDARRDRKVLALGRLPTTPVRRQGNNASARARGSPLAHLRCGAPGSEYEIAYPRATWRPGRSSYFLGSYDDGSGSLAIGSSIPSTRSTRAGRAAHRGAPTASIPYTTRARFGGQYRHESDGGGRVGAVCRRNPRSLDASATRWASR